MAAPTKMRSDSPPDQADLSETFFEGRRGRGLRVYMMDLWSFIPYYVGQLCVSLQKEQVNVTLGSARYHLDRNYFQKVGLKPDSLLFDSGGGIGIGAFRRFVKSLEYLANLFILATRFLFSPPDILHVQYLPFLERGFSFEMWFLAWAKLRGIRIVYTVHNVTPQNAPGRYRPLQKRMYRLPHALICHGEGARSELIKDFEVAPDKIRVIPHGPLFAEKPVVSPEEARTRLGLSMEEPLVLSLGVISEYKGIPFLLEAWKKLKVSGCKGRLLVAGTGDSNLLLSIREKVSADGLAASVDLWLEFIPVEKLPLLYQAADILAYPYKAGTTSGALLTGMNYGKAIIATKVPFFREYLRDGENALLVDYGDTEALAQSLRLLIEEHHKRARIASALGCQNSAEVSWSTIAKHTRNCYKHVLEFEKKHHQEE
jgi:glycosyltransferase involved in cell wall biosynthesis